VALAGGRGPDEESPYVFLVFFSSLFCMLVNLIECNVLWLLNQFLCDSMLGLFFFAIDLIVPLVLLLELEEVVITVELE
jgi:hypothetical protein